MIIGYLRVSTGKEVFAKQKDELHRFAEDRNLKVDGWETDTGCGKQKERDRKLVGLLQRMKRGDTIIVTEISQLSHTLTDLMSVINKCQNKSINLQPPKRIIALTALWL